MPSTRPGGIAIGTGRGRREETRLQNEATAATNAVQPTPYERYQQPLDLKLLQDLDSGKDVSEIDGLRWSYNLFQNAGQDPELEGAGLLGNNALAGGNQSQLGLIAKQIKARERQQNEGMLYDSVQDARAGAMGRSQGFSGMEDSRNRFRAEMANQRYSTYLNRPRPQSAWERILLGGMSSAAKIGSAAIRP